VANLEALLAISRYAGDDLLLVQGGGGNTSVKSTDGRRMWIKASGLRLAQLRAGFGYVETDLAALRTLLRNPALHALPPDEAHAAAVAGVHAAVTDSGGLRASLETTVHAMLDPLVLHTHPVYANAFTCMVGGEAALAEVCATHPQFLDVTWVPYATPGIALAYAIADSLGHNSSGASHRPPVILLSNHGLITHGSSPETLIALTARLAQLGRRVFGPLPAGALELVTPSPTQTAWAAAFQSALHHHSLLSSSGVVCPARWASLHRSASQPDQWLCAGPLVPDDVVYLRRQVFVAPARATPDEFAASLVNRDLAGRLAVAVPGHGLFLAGPSVEYVRAMEENLLAHVLIRRLIAQAGGQPRPVAVTGVEALCAMEAEKYRRAIAAAAPLNSGSPPP
jgi:rhamnose utilization protein RhaD (predicted bifunctional aldolase and dehydrogenase)